jgi:DNA-3-methyladenine glycosylase
MALPRAFFARDTLEVARALLGQRLVRLIDGLRLGGLVTETEAYVGETDKACTTACMATSSIMPQTMPSAQTPR